MPDGVEGRWLSYQELGEVLGCTANASRMHAVRRKWPRRSPNQIGGCATVLVPKEVALRPCVTNTAERASHAFDAQTEAVQANGHAPENDAQPDSFDARATNSAIEALREQLAITNGRVDEEHARADRAEQRLDEERTRTADAQAAERIARDEAAGLRAELDARKQWSLWRRVRGR